MYDEKLYLIFSCFDGQQFLKKFALIKFVKLTDREKLQFRSKAFLSILTDSDFCSSEITIFVVWQNKVPKFGPLHLAPMKSRQTRCCIRRAGLRNSDPCFWIRLIHEKRDFIFGEQVKAPKFGP